MRVGSARLRKALRAAEKAGWRIEQAQNGFLVYPPDGSRPIAVHSSDREGHRGTPHAILQMRKAGLVL